MRANDEGSAFCFLLFAFCFLLFPFSFLLRRGMQRGFFDSGFSWHRHSACASYAVRVIKSDCPGARSCAHRVRGRDLSVLYWRSKIDIRPLRQKPWVAASNFVCSAGILPAFRQAEKFAPSPDELENR
jgi:hypothetical protein